MKANSHLRKAGSWIARVWQVFQMGRMNPILRACVLTVLCALCAAFGFYLLIRTISPTDESKRLDPQYPIQFGLWIAGGIGGVVALVVAYRRQKMAEESIFVERFGAAAAQLGAEDPAVRMAGVYAMAGVADEGTASQRQQCVDVLCGYLRRPYHHGGDASGTTQLVVRKPGQTPNDALLETTFKYRLHDKEVRATILRVLASHLRTETPASWSSCNIDLSGAALECAQFSGANFTGTTTFAGASFTEGANFFGTNFTEDAEFAGASFSEGAIFAGAKFAEGASFSEAIFTGEVTFFGASFSKWAIFGKASFTDEVTFMLKNFAAAAIFHGASFTGDAIFHGARFAEGANFNEVRFSPSEGSLADFRSIDYGPDPVTFLGVDFGAGVIDFSEPTTWDPSPKFAWDADFTSKPTNIIPAEWPPEAAPQDSK